MSYSICVRRELVVGAARNSMLHCCYLQESCTQQQQGLWFVQQVRPVRRLLLVSKATQLCHVIVANLHPVFLTLVPNNVRAACADRTLLINTLQYLLACSSTLNSQVHTNKPGLPVLLLLHS